jgi:hypothetical protein
MTLDICVGRSQGHIETVYMAGIESARSKGRRWGEHNPGKVILPRKPKLRPPKMETEFMSLRNTKRQSQRKLNLSKVTDLNRLALPRQT